MDNNTLLIISDILVRLTALENLLTEKNVLVKEEILDCQLKMAKLLSKKIEEAQTLQKQDDTSQE